MAARNILHISQLEAFTAYLLEKGYRHQPPSRNEYEVLRMKKGRHVVVLFKRLNAKEHLSVMDKDLWLVFNFFGERRKRNAERYDQQEQVNTFSETAAVQAD